MSFKIVADSSCDLNSELKEMLNVALVPLIIQVNNNEYRDDSDLDVQELLEEMNRSKSAPKTASPSPADFMKEYEKSDTVFVVTLSSHLSSTYNSAILAKNMMENVGNKFIHVFDSLSASVGETLVSLKISELAKRNCENLHIVEKVNEYIKEMKTYFLIESLDNLIKAGRINSLKGMLASLLSIKPIMGGENGEIKLVEKVRGSQKAFSRLAHVIGEQGEKLDEKILGIAHCNCLERALKFKEEVLKLYNFKEIIIVEMAGLSSVYANNGGLVIAF